MTFAVGTLLRNSCASPSVRDLTAAFEALYAGLPLQRARSAEHSDALAVTHGGLVIPCFEPVLMITAGFS